MSDAFRPSLRDELLVLLREHVDEKVPIDASTTMSGDLGLGSVELMEIAAEIEDRFGVRLPDELLPALRTVDDVARALEARLRP